MIWLALTTGAAAQTTFTWSSTAATNAFETAANWNGNNTPTNDGSSALVFSTWTTYPDALPTVKFSANFDAYSLSFTGGYPHYYLDTTTPVALGLSHGINVGAGGYADFAYGGPAINLTGHQTWQVDGSLSVFTDINGAYSLDKTGNGTLAVGGNGAFGNGLSVQAGTLLIANSSTYDEDHVASGPVGTGTLSLADGTTAGVLFASSYTLHNAVELDASSAATVHFDIQSGGSLNLAGNLTGSANLVKAGTGTLMLSGYVGNYYGNGTVNAGSLILNGTSFYGQVAINNGGTFGLKGDGYVINTITVNDGGRLVGQGGANEAIINSGGTLAPGFSAGLGSRIGTLHFPDLTLGQNSTVEIDVQHLGSGEFTLDQIFVTTPATLTILADSGNPLTLKLASLNGDGQSGQLTGGLVADTTYYLDFLFYDVGISGDLVLGTNLFLDTSAFDSGFASNTFGLLHDGNTFRLTFTPTAIPEPSTCALLGGLGGLGLALWRRRRA